MPKAAPRPCTHPGCGVLVKDGTGRCARHPKLVWEKAVPVKRISGRKLQRLRAELFDRAPLCVECSKHGRVTIATQRDHIVPLEEWVGPGSADQLSNIQGLCVECHEIKSKAERVRGARRARSG